jgi:hypothetical protein
VPSIRRIFRLAPLALLCALPAFAADNITGTVTNKTINKPSAGDDVVLIRLQQGMQESTRTKTDARGHFSLAVPDEGIHLVRVTHDKANYFQPAPPGTNSVNLDVYNAAAKVKGVTGEADVMRIQSDAGGKSLHVVENFFIKNESTPPLTQFSERPFEFILPEGAVVEGSAALAPGGMPVQAAPVPLPEKGHYTFLFPIRPGETRFQVTYRLPYSGSFTFSPTPTLTTDTVAIIMPKSMIFKPDTSAASSFSPVTEETTSQTYAARNVSPGQPLGFTLSGAGQLPRETEGPEQAAGQQQGATPADANAGAGVDANGNPDTTKFGGGLGKPIDPNADHDPWSKYKWWILGCIALLMAGAAGILLRRPATPVTEIAAVPMPPANHKAALQHVLKEELFALETERLQKKISESDYVTQKDALNVILLRTLSRDKSTDAS